MLTELKNRGVADVLMVVCDGLTGLPDAISTIWSQTITQTCVVHLLRNSFRYAGRQHWDPIAKALKPVYTAPTEAAARERFAEFAEVWGSRLLGGVIPNSALSCRRSHVLRKARTCRWADCVGV